MATINFNPRKAGPGKTAPRLHTDLLSYNPYNNGINVLSELPPHYDDTLGSIRNYLRSAHRHRLALKVDQTSLQNAKQTSLSASDLPQYASAACTQCRLHIKVETSLNLSKIDQFQSNPCPSTDYPLHHFRYEPEQSSPIKDPVHEPLSSDPPERQDVKIFSCTAPQCGVFLKITISAARITPEFKELLTNNKKLLDRAQRALELHKEKTEDPQPALKPATPTKVLQTLRSALANVLKGTNLRNIPIHNPTFLRCLGEDCRPIMERMKFTLTEDQTGFAPPMLPDDEGPFLDETRILYDDWIQELGILQDSMKASSGADEKIFSFTPVEAEPTIKALIGCTDYESNRRRSQYIDLTKDEHPRYASLGAQSDFSDKLLLWAYKRQRDCDDDDRPYYLECLEDLSRGRQSEDLQFEVASIRSQGEYTLKDVKEAYDSIGADPNCKDEDLIIGIFNSRLLDSPKQESQLRQSLRLIGQHLKSAKISNFTMKTIMDVNQAYARFGVESHTESSFIISVFNVNMSDNPGDEAQLREALKCIAESRSDHVLLNFLETGSAIETVMNLDAAFERLGLEDRDMPDEDIIAIFKLRLQDAPSQISDLRSALKAIAESRESQKIRTFLATGQEAGQIPKGSKDSPVGLENIGNTCYLNSLLQFYFTVRPLREVISDHLNHQEDEITEEVLERKRVGGRKVTQREVERAKRFVSLLQQLFTNMVNSPFSSVTPERELAYLALISSREDNEPQRPMSLSNIDSNTPGFIGPHLPDHLKSEDEMEVEPKSLPFEMDMGSTRGSRLQVVNSNDDVASEVTLVGESEELPPYPKNEDQTYRKNEDDIDYVMVDDEDDTSIGIGNKENHLPNRYDNDDSFIGGPDDRDMEPLLSGQSNSPATLQDETLADADGNHIDDHRGLSSMTNQPLTPPPDRPPPIPPRPEKKTTRRDSELMFNLGRQQDVTECIENVMFQIESALKPDAIDTDGEQLDIIKRLFYGKTKQSLQFPGSDPRHKEEYFSHLLVDVAEGNRDIYSALDSIFDASNVDLEGREAKRYVSLSQLPPILQIQIQRVQFDRASGTPFKSENQLRFPPTIYLDRYVDDGDPEIARLREESWELKLQLTDLEKQKSEITRKIDDLAMPDALEKTGGFLQSIKDDLNDESGAPINPGVIQEIAQEKEQVDSKIKDIDSQIKDIHDRLEQQFGGLTKHGYRIHSVFIHRGSVSFGHYWIYIYDFQRKIYRKYNDGYVTEVEDENEVFSHGTGQPATPYFLVFVRTDKEDMTEAVCRNI